MFLYTYNIQWIYVDIKGVLIMFSVPKVGPKAGFESAGSLAAAPRENPPAVAFAAEESAGSLACNESGGGLNVMA